jgi:hypothetical protein
MLLGGKGDGGVRKNKNPYQYIVTQYNAMQWPKQDVAMQVMHWMLSISMQPILGLNALQCGHRGSNKKKHTPSCAIAV